MGVSLAGIAVIAAGGALTGKGPAGALKGKPPTPPPTPLMPDQTTINQAQQLKEAQAAALRQGRASTVLTNNADTGDKLGP
jgi:hypothetical protein